MNRIAAIGVNTFREAVRDRILYGVIAFASLVLIFTLALAELALDRQARVVRNVGLMSISYFSVFSAIFLGSSLLYKEIERKTLYIILPKPIHRWEFLIGKFFGITLTVSVFVAVMGAIQLFVMSFQADSSSWQFSFFLLVIVALSITLWKIHHHMSAWFIWSILVFGTATIFANQSGIELEPILAMLVLRIGEISILTAVALFFSSFSTPFTTGGLTLGMWIVGRSADSLETVRTRLLGDELKTILHGIAKVVPNFNLYVPHSSTLEKPWPYVGTSLAYSVAYTSILLIFAAFLFRRRDFL